MLAIRRRVVVTSYPLLEGLAVHRETSAEFMAALQARAIAEISGRFGDGHRAYVAWLDGQPAAWGWVATKRAEIGELAASFEIPAQQRYLWNFVTLPGYRGRGIYSRLLDAIVCSESAEAELFWIAYAPENAASGAGIHKAGFTTVATLSFDANGRPAVLGHTPEYGGAAARLLGIPAADATLSQCWHCVRVRRATSSCRITTCTCDYQKPELACG